MRNAVRQPKPVTNRATDAITQYITALEEFYPAAKGATTIVRRPDQSVIVKVPLPKRDYERMRLFDHMAEVALRLLLETDELIIISSR